MLIIFLKKLIIFLKNENTKTKFKDLFVIQSERFIDNRGYFRELLLEKSIKKKLNFFVVSKSKKNVVRGLHFQLKILKENMYQLLKVKFLMLQLTVD